MNWTRIFLFALLTLCATGSMAQIGMYLCTYLFKIKNPFVMLAMQKGVAAAFTLPILFTVIFFRHAGDIFRRVERGIVGVFWVDSLKIDDKVCLVLIGGMIHWYHPWQRALEKNFIAEQEIVCDLRASTGHPAFTQKEYGKFLVGLSDYQYGNLPITAFHESKNIIIRRLSAMTQAKKLKKPKGWLLAASCAGLLAAALLPASAVSA